VSLRRTASHNELTCEKPKARQIAFGMAKGWQVAIEINHLLAFDSTSKLTIDLHTASRKNGKLHFRHPFFLSLRSPWLKKLNPNLVSFSFRHQHRPNHRRAGNLNLAFDVIARVRRVVSTWCAVLRNNRVPCHGPSRRHLKFTAICSAGWSAGLLIVAFTLNGRFLWPSATQSLSPTRSEARFDRRRRCRGYAGSRC
jgi:hypothetical protein